MKVGINGRAFSDSEPDGAVQTGIELTRRLIDRDELEVIVYGHRDVHKCFNRKVKIESSGYITKSQFFGVVWERTVLPGLVVRDNVDVLLCPNGNAPPYPIPGCLVLMYIHDVNALKKLSSGIHRVYRSLMVPLGAKFADKVLTVSEFSKSEISESISITPDKIKVVYNGVDEIFFDDSDGQQFDLPEKYILYVGAMNPRKNVNLLVDSYLKLAENGDIEHKLVLVGPRNKRVYKNLDIGEQNDDIIVTGFITEEQLKYAYKNADLFVYPSFYEGFGLPPLEAMACGTPTIASNTSSLPEVLDSAAELIDPYDPDDLYNKMYQMLTDESVRVSLKKAGRQRAEEFTWTDSVQQLVNEFYTE